MNWFYLICIALFRNGSRASRIALSCNRHKEINNVVDLSLTIGIVNNDKLIYSSSSHHLSYYCNNDLSFLLSGALLFTFGNILKIFSWILSLILCVHAGEYFVAVISSEWICASNVPFAHSTGADDTNVRRVTEVSSETDVSLGLWDQALVQSKKIHILYISWTKVT